MDIRKISDQFFVAPQIAETDLAALREKGIRSVICNRPDGEGADQPAFKELCQTAEKLGMQMRYIPITGGLVQNADAAEFRAALDAMPKPVLGYCRTGTRSATLWSLALAPDIPLADILSATKQADYDMKGVVRRIANGGKTPVDQADASYDIVIVGGGASGIAVAASLKARKPELDIAVIDPAEAHYYQPGWTMVGGGIFEAEETVRTMGSLIPKGVHWLKSAVAAFEPEKDAVILDGCRVVKYNRLVVCPGLKLDWARVEGLVETLGRNGVTSNYRYDLAPYTWKLVSQMKSGRALFTQPPMPIKCAGAPQKSMYLSADHWTRKNVIKDIDIGFHNAGGVLFGIKDYVPALQSYVDKYQIGLNFFQNLVAIDGPAKKAWFDVAKPDTVVTRVEVDFDMIHVTLPQCAPDFIAVSPLADGADWVDVDQATLRHKTYENIWSLGDVMNAPNAKTAAAARKQAPVVADNIVGDMCGLGPVSQYDGYGSCPLTVERAKIVLAEFGYGGILQRSFPSWLIDGTKPSRLAWLLKEKVLPPVYWKAMLKGREWLASPEKVSPR